MTGNLQLLPNDCQIFPIDLSWKAQAKIGFAAMEDPSKLIENLGWV